VKQPSLFDHCDSDARRALDRESEARLSAFRTARLQAGAHPQSVAREVSQLRSIVRASEALAGPRTIDTVFEDMDAVARLLSEPPTPIAQTTGRARLGAAQRYIEAMSASCGRCAEEDLSQLDDLLPGRRGIGWHTSGIAVVGARGRRRRRGPTLDATDLDRLIDAAAEAHAQDGWRARRDRTLVALMCYSGLHPTEVTRLTWEALSPPGAAASDRGLMVTVRRGERSVQVALPQPAVQALRLWKWHIGRDVLTPAGWIFRRSAESPHPLGYRAARNIVTCACRRAGLPAVEAVDLRAAYAHWLRTHGFSDHEVATIQGIRRVRTIDRLLKRHMALDAQRRMREVLER